MKNLRWLAANVNLPIALPALMEALQGMRHRRSCKAWRPPRKA